MKSKLLIGVALAAFAFASATDMASAASSSAKRHHARKLALPASGIPNCGKGMAPILHNVASGGKTHWSCQKPGAF
jgi:hypothetical protein